MKLNHTRANTVASAERFLPSKGAQSPAQPPLWASTPGRGVAPAGSRAVPFSNSYKGVTVGSSETACRSHLDLMWKRRNE